MGLYDLFYGERAGASSNPFLNQQTNTFESPDLRPGAQPTYSVSPMTTVSPADPNLPGVQKQQMFNQQNFGPQAQCPSGFVWDPQTNSCVPAVRGGDRDGGGGIGRDREVATADSEFRSGLVPQSQWEADLQLQLAKALAGTDVGKLASLFGHAIPTTHTGLARQQAESNRAWNQDVIRAQADDYAKRAVDAGTTVHEVVQRDRDRDRDPGPSGAERAARAAAASRSDSASSLGGANRSYSNTGPREVGGSYDPRNANAGGMVGYNKGGIVDRGIELAITGLGKLGVNPDAASRGIVMAGDVAQTLGFNEGGMSGKVSKIYNEGYTAPGQAYAIAKSMGYNYGGPVMMQDGGMTPGQSPVPPMMREGPQHDTVGAQLTPGEMVIDADSTEAINQVAPGFLEAVNQWEPAQGMKGLMNIFNSLDDVAVTKTDAAGNKVSIKSPEGSRMMTLFGEK